ncbi:hypothetical protein KAJ27_06120 [bacterium]|nr:hypothetical protein [bacterium]
MEKRINQIIDNVSDVYASLLPDFFHQPFPLEDLATCDHCIMITDRDNKKNDGAEVRGSFHEYCIFHPDVKCCTYQPDLPNFLVGAILSSKRSSLSEGQRRIKEILLQGVGVTPESIIAIKSSTQEYSQLIDCSPDCDPEIGCPYFNKVQKNCSIWLFRQANCSTFFCKSVEGIAGQIFWSTMNFYLSSVEKQLADYVLQRFGPSTGDEMWNQDKTEFYINAYASVKGLNRAGFKEICGTDLDEIFEQVQYSYAEATRSTVPEKLKKNPDLQYNKLADAKYQYDTGHGRCVLSSQVHSTLSFFDGKATNKQVIERVLIEQKIRISSAFILRLFKNLILVSVADET